MPTGYPTDRHIPAAAESCLGSLDGGYQYERYGYVSELQHLLAPSVA